MAFSDETIKRLRNRMQGEPFLVMDNADLTALLSRLDAAEEVIRNLQMSAGSIEFFLANANSVEAWRKSKGDA